MRFRLPADANVERGGLVLGDDIQDQLDPEAERYDPDPDSKTPEFVLDANVQGTFEGQH